MQMSRRNNRNSRHFFTEAEVNERGMGSRFAFGLLFPWGGGGKLQTRDELRQASNRE